MRDFIRFYLGPRFRQAGIAWEIWAGTIERPDYDAWRTLSCGTRVPGLLSEVWDSNGQVRGPCSGRSMCGDDRLLLLFAS
jgi:hypothetical protein